ncbi:MAG TPA: protein kinase, partial [Polyangiaceae bacterium]
MPELDLEERVLLASIQARVLRAPLEPVRLGTFELVRKIGTGGMGVVYVARDVRKDGLVALKTLPRPSPRGIAQLKEEFRIAADLTHPNLIVLYELAFDADRPYFTMELVDGTDAVSALRSALSAEDGRAAARPFHDLVTQLFSALGFLQARARIHRDLKPGNVMVTSAGRVVVLDFGLTREIATTTRASSRGPWGTPGYMSPEQTRGERLTAKSDCYAAGVLLAESCAPDHATARAAIQRGPAAIAELAGAARALVPEFPALLAGLLEEDVALRLDAEAALELLLQSQRRLLSPAPELTPVFVGRRRELALLDQALAAAREQARVVLVSGGAGLGKTALVRAFLERVPDGVTSLSGRCFESDSVPYKALDTLVESLAKHLSAL